MRKHGLTIGVVALVGAMCVPAAAQQENPAAAGQALSVQPAHAPQALSPPDVPVGDVMAHLRELQRIANANGGTRAAGTPGYQASLDYLRSRLEAAGFSTHLQRFSYRYGTSYNLIATYPGADPSDEVVMVGAHLDSVRVGPGINDNGSGTAAVLEVALTFAERNVDPDATLRFAWWGAEELGLVGSRHYVQSLSRTERNDIAAYLNADMVGSPNAGYFVYGGEDAESEQLQATFEEYFDSIGVPTEGLNISGRSDHAPFLRAGIPAAGASTGAGARKTPAQARKWGGTAGRPFDPCYHRACDTINNINRTALDRMSDAFAYTVWELATVDDGSDDTEAPTVPSGLRVTGTTSSSVSLSWDASSDNVGVTGYIVYQDGARVDMVDATSTTVTGLAPSTSYTFTVAARDAAGNTSDRSDPVTATTQGDGDPPETGTWEPYTSYQVGDRVTYNGQEYVCRIAHTSLPGWEPPNTPALWQPV